MAGIFDGMAGLLNDVFGDPVTHLPRSGVERVVQGIFRAPPIDLLGEDGRTVLDTGPRLRVPKPAADGIAVGDMIRPASGPLYRVINPTPGGSPAADAFVIFQLEVAE